MIGIIADHAARYTWFSQSLAELDKPDGTVTEWRTGANRGATRNSLAQACLDQDCDWLFFLDDDQAFAPQVLRRLLSWKEPVVSALIVQRGKPFLPTAYATFDGAFHPLDLSSIGADNLVLCAGVGTGGLLVQAEVFRQLEGEPWFVYTEEFGEDLYFSRRCAEAGIQMVVDTGCRIGHIIPAAMFAMHDGFDWSMGIQLAEGTRASV